MFEIYPSRVSFLCFPRRLLEVLLNQDKEVEIILALNSYLTKEYMWTDQMCIKSDFVFKEILYIIKSL